MCKRRWRISGGERMERPGEVVLPAQSSVDAKGAGTGGVEEFPALFEDAVGKIGCGFLVIWCRVLEVGVGKVNVWCWWPVVATLDLKILILRFARGSVAVKEALEL